MDRQLLEMSRALRQRILDLERDVRFLRRRRTGGPPIRQPVTIQTGTAYTPVPADENTMVGFTNAAAITVTLPSDAAQPIPLFACIDFLWMGAGQPTFVEDTGVTMTATPGPNLRAHGSWATAKKVAANTWLVIGDLAV